MSRFSIQTLSRRKAFGFAEGMALTLGIAIIAQQLAKLPMLSIMGPMVLAILFGMAVRSAMNVPATMSTGIAFSSKKLLRCGIILLGMRLNMSDLVQAGPKVFVLALICLIAGIALVYGFSRWLGVEKKLGFLTACGTGICGAAAVAAISPQVKATEEDTAISAATVAILGTIFTLIYTGLYSVLGLSAQGYGLLSGSTLHEIAHVLAAAAPGGKEAEDMALLVKLTRVALLVPVAILAGWWVQRSENDGNPQKASGGSRWKSLPIPWFILGFLLMAGVNTLHLVSDEASRLIIQLAYLLLAMAMGGMGLQVNFSSLRKKGMKSFVAGLIGSILLSCIGFALIHLFGLI